MDYLIGETAGNVYRYLTSNAGSPVPLDTVRKAVGGPTLVFHMAIGWLAREDKLSFSTRGRTAMVELAEKKP